MRRNGFQHTALHFKCFLFIDLPSHVFEDFMTEFMAKRYIALMFGYISV